MRSDCPNCLVDTNVLLYANDPAELDKGRQALQVISRLDEARAGVVSAQILGEFHVGLCRLQPPLNRNDIAALVAYYARAWAVLPIGADTVMEAVRGVSEHQFSYFDALIWATAKENGLRVVLSEDCHDGRTIEGVRFRNPFAPHFSLESL